MKVGVLGAGAIGCYVGGKLIAAGHEVVLVGRLGAEIAEHGLELTDFAGARVVLATAAVRYVAEPDALAGCDAVLVTVKSMATESAARPLVSILARPTVVLSLQNGVSNPARLRAILPGHVVLAGMVPFNVARIGPGKFHNGTSGPLAVEKRGGAEWAIAAALRGAGFGVEVRSDLEGVQWSKLLLNLNNAVNALAGIPLRQQLADRSYRRVLALCVREGLGVLRAIGVKPVRIGRMVPRVAPIVLSLPDALFFRVASAMVKIDPTARSSMLDDLERRRPTEVDYLNGEIVRLGDQHDVPVPANRTVTQLVKAAEADGKGPPRIPAERLLTMIATRARVA